MSGTLPTLRALGVDPRGRIRLQHYLFGAVNPWEQVRAVLAESKRDGLSWERAWYRAMEAIRPTVGCSMELRRELEDDRDLMREIKPFWRAAYEGRELTAEEFEKSAAVTEDRLDSVLCPA